MYHIPIILGSTRKGRLSPRVAKFLMERMKQTGQINVEILDLLEYNFPIMEERLSKQDNPPPGLREFADKIARADAIVVVSPEYNNSYPGVLKNAIDYLLSEFKRKPIGIVTVSSGPFGGINALAHLRLIFLMMGAIPIPIRLPIAKVSESFDEDGNPKDPLYEKSVAVFIDELLWLTDAVVNQKMKLNQ